MMPRPKNRRVFCLMLLFFLLLFALGVILYGKNQALPAFTAQPSREVAYVIDPGHGGEDGGAVSAAGVPESQVNLAISQRLDALLHFCGQHAILTRNEDVSIHSPDAKTLREKKVSDLHNRVALVAAQEEATLISIHQNAFPVEKYHGMQAFYAQEETSLPLAQAIQGNVSAFLDTSNKRTPLKVPNANYLMSHITCRAVLVECGFLSNPTEARLLQEGPYQTRVALTIAAACLTTPKP